MQSMYSAIKKIDLHTHILPPSHPDWNVEFGETGWLTIVTDEDTKQVCLCVVLFDNSLIHCAHTVFIVLTEFRPQ